MSTERYREVPRGTKREREVTRGSKEVPRGRERGERGTRERRRKEERGVEVALACLVLRLGDIRRYLLNLLK
jgi:hypothetical protein